MNARAGADPNRRKKAEGREAPRRQARQKAMLCPICRKPQAEEYRPFCSKRCADIDLMRWLEGRYAMPGAPAAKDESEEDDDR